MSTLFPDLDGRWLPVTDADGRLTILEILPPTIPTAGSGRNAGLDGLPGAGSDTRDIAAGVTLPTTFGGTHERGPACGLTRTGPEETIL